MKIKSKNETYSFRTIVKQDEGGGFYAFVPLLSGVHTQGETLEEVNKNLREAILCHIEGLVIDNETVPQESDSMEVIHTFSDRDFAFA